MGVMGTKQRRGRERKHRSVTSGQWKKILVFWDSRCAYCGKFGTTENPITKDCILPISRMGIYAPFNLVPACLRCNGSKSSKNVFDWMATKGYDDMDFERKLQIWWQQWI